MLLLFAFTLAPYCLLRNFMRRHGKCTVVTCSHICSFHFWLFFFLKYTLWRIRPFLSISEPLWGVPVVNIAIFIPKGRLLWWRDCGWRAKDLSSDHSFFISCKGMNANSLAHPSAFCYIKWRQWFLSIRVVLTISSMSVV